MKALAKRWATSVAGDTRSELIFWLAVTTGVIFILTYIVWLPQAHILGVIGVWMFYVGFHLFERLGLLLLLDEHKHRQSNVGS